MIKPHLAGRLRSVETGELFGTLNVEAKHELPSPLLRHDIEQRSC